MLGNVDIPQTKLGQSFQRCLEMLITADEIGPVISKMLGNVEISQKKLGQSFQRCLEMLIYRRRNWASHFKDAWKC